MDIQIISLLLMTIGAEGFGEAAVIMIAAQISWEGIAAFTKICFDGVGGCGV